MGSADRSKIFMPVGALTGFNQSLRAVEKEYVPKKLLSEDVREELDFKLNNLSLGESVSVTYYTGSNYHTITGHLTAISLKQRSLSLDDTSVFFKDISDITAL